MCKTKYVRNDKLIGDNYFIQNLIYVNGKGQNSTD